VRTKDEYEFPVSKLLIGFFLLVVVGSSLVEVMNLFTKTKDPLEDAA
jgi:hypothetical protein